MIFPEEPKQRKKGANLMIANPTFRFFRIKDSEYWQTLFLLKIFYSTCFFVSLQHFLIIRQKDEEQV